MAAFVTLTGLVGAALEATGLTPHGQCLDPMYVQLLTLDGVKVQVFTEVRFQDSDFTVYTIPDGFVSDGASIPRAAWSAVGGPLSGRYRRAAVLHDYLMSVGSHERAHAVFRRAMLADGVDPEQAELFYNAVTAATWWTRLGALRRLLASTWRILRGIVPLVRRIG